MKDNRLLITAADGLIDWDATWTATPPEPPELRTAADHLVRAARAGWCPNDDDLYHGWRVVHVLQWDTDHPTGRPLSEIEHVFSQALAAALSEVVREVVAAAAEHEPITPRPGTWGESLVAVLHDDLAH